MFAVDFEDNAKFGSALAYGFFDQVGQGVKNVLGQTPLVVLKNDTDTAPLLAGSKIVRGGKVYLADATRHRVLEVDGNTKALNEFCSDQKMLQPNDIAISTLRDDLIFLSGQNFTADTEAGVSGDLWTCDGSKAIQFPPHLLKQAGIHRTNGIETSPDGKWLYLSSAVNKNSTVISNQIFRFELDKSTGQLVQSLPVLFFDFAQSEATDIDGMRVDVDGNLFVTRNGLGTVVKICPDGKQELTIGFPNMGGPASLEFGDKDGRTLFAVGKCADNATVGCAGSWRSDKVGKAFAHLQSYY